MAAGGVGARLGFIGGTGPEGKGIALRLAMAGHPVLLGSRTAQRAQLAAAEVAALAGGLDVGGAINAEVAAEADVIFVTIPYVGQQMTLPGLGGAVAGKLVVNCVNALAFDGGPHALAVPAGSAAEECRDLLPGARVTAAFHTASGPKLLKPDVDIEGDVLVCGDDRQDRQEVVALVDAIRALRGIHAGTLRHAHTLEALTAMLISVNTLYQTSSGVRLTGVDPARLQD